MTNLTKTCSSCGLQKPLSAFLEMAGPQGTTYGNICASCRKANRDKATAARERDEDTTNKSRLSIDSKEKAKADADKLQLRHEAEERYHEERDKDQEKQKTKTDKVKEITKKQIEHRKSFLEKPTFLDHKNIQSQNLPNSPSEIALNEQRMDMANPVLDTQIPKRKRIDNPFFNEFVSRLEKSSPIAQAAQREALTQKAVKKGSQPQGASEKDAANYAENNFEKERPKKRPRR